MYKIIKEVKKENRSNKRLLFDIKRARRDVNKGNVYTLEQVQEILDLK